jgi:hypothetical protein
MSINQHNFELFILDYYEGKLDAAATGELMLYLEQNRDAREAFESYEAIMLTPDLSRQYEPKSSLKKTVVIAVGELNEENYEKYFMESVENNLSATQLSNLSEFVGKNPQLQKTLDNYKKTVLQPDLSLVFEGKEMLKKTLVVPLRPTPLRRMIVVSISVAAVLAVVLISGIILSNINTTDKNGSYAFSFVDISKSLRKTSAVVKQNEENDIPQSGNKVSYQTNTQNITFADMNSSNNKPALDKLQIKKGTYIEPTIGKELTASVVLLKRSEYSNLIDERELLLSRRNKESTSQEEGLADYVVNGIKNAARSTAKNKEDIKDNKRLGFWDIAGFGVYTYNKITNNNLTLNKQTDASGRLMSFNLEDNSTLSGEKK